MSRRTIGVVAHREKLRPAVAVDLRDRLAEAGFAIEWKDVDKGSAATKATRRLLDRGAHHIIACGGDGTVRATAAALVKTGVPLSVVPAGTANVFCTSLCLPTEVSAIVAALLEGTDLRLDVGRCNGEAFVLMAGTGLDATLIDQADEAKEKVGRLAYVMAGARAAHTAERFPVKVKIDGTTMFDGDASCVLVANIGQLMGGVTALPHARPDDGRLDVAVSTAHGLGQWGGVAWRTVRRKLPATDLVHLGNGERVRITLDDRRRFELDGGTKGKADRLKIDVVHHGLTVRRPFIQ